MESGALLVSKEPSPDEPTVLQLLTSEFPEKFSPAFKVRGINNKNGTLARQENKLFVFNYNINHFDFL